MATLTSRLILALVDRVTTPARGVQGTMARLNDRIEANQRKIRQTRGDFIGAAAGLTAFGFAMVGPIRSAMELESAMADVRKVADFTPEGLEAFKDELQELSRRIPMATTDLAALAAAAAQAGIATEDLASFTEKAAMVGTAFDISADEAGGALAKLMTAMDLSIDEVVLLSDAMNHLSNTQASSASEILDVVRRVGAQSRQFGFNATEVSAFASAMISAGAQSEVAATSFRNMGAALTRGSSATKRQSSALAKLGLDAEEVARAMQDDAVGTVLDVLDKIGQMPEEMRAAISTDLFGAEARALGPLITNTDLLRQSLGLVGDESDYAGSAMEEFANRNETFAAELQKFRNRLGEIGTELGESLLPVLTEIMDTLGPIATALADWIDEHPNATKWIIMLTGAAISLRTAFLGFKLLGLIGKGGILTLAASGLGAVVTAAKGAATVGAMATAVGRLASAAARLSALGSIPLIGGGARIDAPNAQERPRGLIDDIGDWWKGDGDSGASDAPTNHGSDPSGLPPTHPLHPSSFVPRSSWAPPANSSGGSSRTANFNGDVHVNVAQTNAAPEDIARALGDELRGLMNSDFSDGAVA